MPTPTLTNRSLSMANLFTASSVTVRVAIYVGHGLAQPSLSTIS